MSSLSASNTTGTGFNGSVMPSHFDSYHPGDGDNVSRLAHSTSAVENRIRHVAILVGKGADAAIVNAIYDDLLVEGAMPHIVGCQVGEITAADKDTLDVEVSLEVQSLWYDAVVVVDGAGSMPQLARSDKALDFIRKQYHHYKPILVVDNGVKLFSKTNISSTLFDGSPNPAIFIGAGLQLKKVFTAFKDALNTDFSFKRQSKSVLA